MPAMNIVIDDYCRRQRVLWLEYIQHTFLEKDQKRKIHEYAKNLKEPKIYDLPNKNELIPLIEQYAKMKNTMTIKQFIQMGNACQATQDSLPTEISDESTGPQTVKETNDRENVEVPDKSYSSPILIHLQLINLDLIEPDQFIPQIKPNRRTLSFVNERTQKQIVRSRTPSHKIDSDTISMTKQPIKSSLKSINSRKGSSNKSQKSVRWDSDLSVFLNLTHYQNYQI